MIPDKELHCGGGDCWQGPDCSSRPVFGIADMCYTTAVVGNVSTSWIKHIHATSKGKPFMAYIAPKAAHEPFNPAPWYVDHWDPSWPDTEPRSNPAWNSSAEARANHAGTVVSTHAIRHCAAACAPCCAAACCSLGRF